MTAERPYPPRSGDEKVILQSYLDWYREALLDKITDLSDADMKRRLVASETTLFGIVHHLAYVERWWFQDVFAGRTVEYPWTDEDPDAEWHVEGSIPSDEAIALYRRECDISRQIAAGADLKEFAKHEEFQDMILRRIMVHMIEETARHVGHADILRPIADGRAGLLATVHSLQVLRSHQASDASATAVHTLLPECSMDSGSTMRSHAAACGCP